MAPSLRNVYRSVWELLFAGSLFLVAFGVGAGLVVVTAVLWALGLPYELAGMLAAAIVGVGGFAAILYGGYRWIDW